MSTLLKSELDIYETLLVESINKLNIFCSDDLIKEPVKLALDKTLNKIKEGKISPAIFPILLEQDLKLNKKALAIDLSIICAYFHTSADLMDDIQDKSKNNSVINKYGISQATNISTYLLFLYQQLILSLDIPEKNKIKLLNHFAKCGNKMVNGQFYDIELTNKINFPEKTNINQEFIVEISKNKSGEEISCFISCILVALDKEHELFYEFGALYGTLIQIFSDYIDIWGQLFSDDLIDLKSSLPIFSSFHDTNLKNMVRFILAGKNDSSQKQFELKRFLSKTEAVENLKILTIYTQRSINEILDSLPQLDNFSKMSNELISSCYDLLNIILELRDISKNDKISTSLNLDNVINDAIDYINPSTKFENTWEIQKNSFLNQPLLIANIFTPALMAETMVDLGQNVDNTIDFLMNLKGYKGWYYYTNSRLIPTDSDILGQLLNIVSRTNNKSKYEHLFYEPLEILLSNIEESGRCPTWLDDKVEHFKESIEKSWYGNSCLGVMANLYYGLALYDYEKYSLIIKKGINYIISNLFKESEEKYNGEYYNTFYKFYLISRLVNHLNLNFEALNNLKNKILSSQCLDGSWNNSPQDTSFALLGLNTYKDTDSSILKNGLKFLVDTQNYDGSWEQENLYVCPNRNGKLTYYKNTNITTAFCLRALNNIKLV